MKIVNKKENLFTCVCCGFKTLKDIPPGTYEICSLCWWEDEDVSHPDEEGGPNEGSLRAYQREFYKVDENKKLTLGNLNMPEDIFYEFDENWKPLDE